MRAKIVDANRLLKFIVVGSSGVAVNTIVLYIGHEVVGLPLLLASTLAVETAIVSNFIWNNLWTFSQSSFAWQRLLKFNLVSLGGLVITLVVLYVLVQHFALHYLVANLLAIGVATAWNFLINSLWTWGGAL